MKRSHFARTFGAVVGSAVVPVVAAADDKLLRLASSSDEVIAAVLYARDAKLFERAGLEVAIEKQNSGAAIAAAVTSGTYDLGTSSLISLLNARQRGFAFSLIAPGAAYDAKSPISQLLVANDSAIRAAADLNGKTVAIQSLADLDTIATRAWVDQHGGDSKTLRFVEIPMSAKAAALDAHRVDAAIVGQPYLTEALNSGKIRVLASALSSVASRFCQSAWFATTAWFVAHRQAAAKFAGVISMANSYTNGHHAEVAPLLAQFSHFGSAELRGVLGTSLNAADIQPVIDIAVKYHLIEPGVTARELLQG
jgi:NitT/TauT family transport system substrate-binding protein